MPHCRARFAVLLVLFSAVLGGCTPSTGASSPTPTVIASTASPTPTLSEGQKAANDIVVKYRALVDQLRQQYKPDMIPLLEVSGGAAYEKWRYTIQEDFVNGYHQTGVAVLTINSTDPGTSVQQWLVSGCLDVTRVDIVDKNGKTTMAHPGGINKVTYVMSQEIVHIHVSGHRGHGHVS